MTSRSVSLSGSQAPRVHVAPRAASKTYGDLAADFASDYGLTPDPWQQVVLDDWLAEKAGQWSSLTCGLSVPRQNGKNALLEVRELFGTVGRGERILHTAHEVKTARKAFKRLQHFFGTRPDDPAAKYPELNALVREIRNVNGQEAVVLKNGGSVEIVARSKNSARGFTVDVLVMDEAQEMTEDDLEALMPTTSSAPLGNPQWIFTGTPPGPRANGEIFTRVRREAIDGKSKRLAWHEWSFAPGATLDDREQWTSANPALITGRLQMAVIEGERARFSDEGFARERGGVWDETSSTQSAVPYGPWLELSDPSAERGTGVSFGADVAEDRSAWIAVAWRREDGAAQVMLANDGAPMPTFRLADECARLTSAWGGAVIPPRAFEDDIERAGAPVQPMKSGDFPAASEAFADAVKEGQIRHGNQTALNEAVRAAKWRSAGANGEKAFQLKNCPEAGPLAAAARALHGLSTSNPTGWMIGL